MPRRYADHQANFELLGQLAATGMVIFGIGLAIAAYSLIRSLISRPKNAYRAW